jgi:hypothetical protein
MNAKFYNDFVTEWLLLFKSEGHSDKLAICKSNNEEKMYALLSLL